MRFVYNDGGRKAAGFNGDTGDCVVRAIAIASGLDYGVVYEELAAGTEAERQTKRGGKTSGRRTAREGIHTTRQWFKDWMARHGWTWTPTMGIGTGCKVHLTDGELPMDRSLIVAVSKHYTAIVHGVIYDTHDPQREAHRIDFNGASRSDDPRAIHSISRRCVYGYWSRA